MKWSKGYLPGSICTFSGLLPQLLDLHWCNHSPCSPALRGCDRLQAAQKQKQRITWGSAVNCQKADSVNRLHCALTRTDISVSVSVAVLRILCYFVGALVGLIPDFLKKRPKNNNNNNKNNGVSLRTFRDQNKCDVQWLCAGSRQWSQLLSQPEIREYGWKQAGKVIGSPFPRITRVQTTRC